MAVKTILVGMGSFGHDVCQQIAQRIEAEHGSLDRVPWLRIMVYETEPQTRSLLANRKLVKHMGVDSTTWQSYMQKPAQYDESIDFTRWADSSIRNVMLAGGVPTKGANNVRPTGRLCFLDQRNLSIFKSDFTRHYNDLSELTEAEATRKAGLETDAIRFAGIGAKGRNTIQVFVIGSLAGGTNSGCFIDVGYYLQTLDGIGEHLVIDCFLAVPDKSYSVEVHWSNVFGALTELNHFTGGKAYRAKFADRATETRSALSPFHMTFLMQSTSGRATQTASLGPVINAVSEIIYLRSVIDPESSVDTTLVNALGNYSNERDRDGRPMPYFSMGASVILFPADHIIEGLSARLASEAIQEALTRRSPAQGDIDHFAAQLAVDEQSYQTRMLAHPKVERYLIELGEETKRAALASAKGDPSARHTIGVKIDNAIAKAATDQSQNFQGEFRAPIFEVTEELKTERLKELDRLVLSMIQAPSQGLHWAKETLNGFITKAEDRLKQLGQPSTNIGIHVDYEAAKERASAYERDLSNPPRKGCNPFAKKPDVNYISQNWAQAKTESYRYSFVIKSGEFEKGVLQALIERAELLKSRLDHPTHGAIQFMTALHDSLHSTFSDRDKMGPAINGISLFEPHRTLGEEWSKCLPNPDSVAKARKVILTFCGQWLKEVVRERNLSIFDRPKDLDWTEEEAVIKAGHEFFVLVRNETVEKRLVTWPHWQQELEKTSRWGKAFIDVDPARNQFGIPATPDNMRRPALIYFHDPKAASGDAGKVMDELKRDQTEVIHWPDRHRILFVEGLAIFAPYTISGVSAAEHRYGEKNRTRSDIAWQKLSGKPLDDQERYQVGLILVGAALGIVRHDMTFMTQAGPMHNAERKPAIPNSDLIDASYHLGRDRVVANDLQVQVQRAIEQMGVDSASREINKFNGGIHEWNWTAGSPKGEPIRVDRKEAFLRELPFMRTIPGLTEAVVGAFPDYPHNGHWVEVPESEHKQAHWSCDRCGQWLAPKAGTRVPDDLVEVCPNPMCGQQIRFDTIIGLGQGR